MSKLLIPSTHYDEVLLAYSDCHEREGYGERNLNFKATQKVSRDTAVDIMTIAVPHGYNEFKASHLQKLPGNAVITIAREYSVCIYVEGQVKRVPGMKADEWSYDPATNETRIWWD